VTDPQHSAAEERIRAELQVEHDERKRRLADKKSRSRVKSDRRRAQEEQEAELQLRRRVEEQFYADNGYKRYIDSRGKARWLLPEEYDWRMKARKERERRHGKHRSFEQPGRASWMIWAGLVVMAVLMGCALLVAG
jgi:hypothetical protein